MTKQMKGIAASSGIAIGKVFQLKSSELTIERRQMENPAEEIQRLNEALEISRRELERIRDDAERNLGEESSEIFTAHLLMLEDPELIGQVKKRIELERINAEAALDDIKTLVTNIFKNIDNQYMQGRVVDFHDVMDRVMYHLLNIEYLNLTHLDDEVVIVAHDLTPSETAQFNKKYVKGVLTNVGSFTSHASIIARTLEIPAIVGVPNITEIAKHGDWIIVDGNEGIVWLNPEEHLINEYKEKQKQFLTKRALWRKLAHESTVTQDNYEIKLMANINSPLDVESVVKNGSEGVGLYRTEYLYMYKDELPTEEEQFSTYQKILEKMNDQPVIVRTLDVGGDKEIEYLGIPLEFNPFLGFRAIRYCLENEEVFRPHIRALLRSSAFGDLHIMFPMISTLEEFRQAKKIVLEEKDRLIEEGYEVKDHIPIGMMVETPAAALIADQFAKEVDFFSIGTNDLIQYTMAADRMNEQVAYLYQPYHPAVLQLIDRILQAARRHGKWVCMCGEMAGDVRSVPVLLALGLDHFSMNPSSILPIRAQIRKFSMEKLQELRTALLQAATSREVISIFNNYMRI